MGKRHRMNGRMRRSMADIKKMRRGTIKLIRRTQEKRGHDSEFEGKKMEDHFFEQRKILGAQFVHEASYMNTVLKVDKIWQRLDGAFVPLQFKSTQRYAHEYVRKFKHFLEKRFKELPVIVVLSPGDKWEDIAEDVLSRVNSWGGNFRFHQWQIKYSKFFDYKNHYYLGPSLKIRKRLFFKDMYKIKKQKETQ